MDEQEPKFAVIAESKEYDKPLYLHNLTFSRLMDDVVVPYQSQASFFIDGVSVNVKSLRRIKIIHQIPSFDDKFRDLHHRLGKPKSQGTRVPAEDYEIRLQALFRSAGDDVTAQVIKAYQERISDRLKEYIPKRKELIDAALQLLLQNLKVLGTSGGQDA